MIKYTELDKTAKIRVLDKIRTTTQVITCKQLYKMVESGEMVFDNAFQRGFVWDVDRESLLIHSILLNYPIPEVMSIIDDGNQSVLDGKQRLGAAVYGFYHGDYALQNIPPVKIEVNGVEDELDINGSTYFTLPENLRDDLDSYAFNVKILDGQTPDEPLSEDRIADIFFRLNNYKPMTAIELTRAKAVSQAVIQRIGQHQIFKNSLTAKALERYTNEDIVIKSYIMLHDNVPSLETKDVRKIVPEMDITEEDEAQLNQIYDRILAMHKLIQEKKVAKRLVTRTHLISVVPFIWKSIQDGLSDADAAEWFTSFFCGKKKATISNTYNNSSGSGSMKRDSVRKRNAELQKYYDNFMKTLAQKSAAKIAVEDEPETSEVIPEVINVDIGTEDENDDDRTEHDNGTDDGAVA